MTIECELGLQKPEMEELSLAEHLHHLIETKPGQFIVPEGGHLGRHRLPSPFADLVKVAQSEIPYARPGVVFEIANETYNNLQDLPRASRLMTCE